MYKSAEFSIDVWPGVVRIHQAWETEDSQTIEIYPSQVEAFILALREVSIEAQKLGDEFEQNEQLLRSGGHPGFFNMPKAKV